MERNQTPLMSQPLSGYLTTQEMADALKVHKTTLAKWRMMRKGPPFTRVGHRVFYSVESTRKWLEAQERFPLTEPEGRP